jgi:hypothetical protein
VNTKILGIDIGAKFVVGFFLDEIPSAPYPLWFRQHGKERIFKLRCTPGAKSERNGGVKLHEAIAIIQELQPDVIVMEPTGIWYSKIWAAIAESLSIPVKWMGHQDLNHNRGNYGFDDKDDRKDAFSLALSYLDPAFGESRWLRFRVGLAAEIHERLLELKGLEPSRIVQLNQMMQRLKFEFPEISNRKITNSRTKDGYTPWIGWLAGIHKYTQIQNEHQRSIANVLDITISPYTQAHALSICTLQQRETALKAELNTLMADPELERYCKVVDKFGFGVTVKAAVISTIYPFEKFLINGRRNVERWDDDRGSHKVDRSRAAFQLSLGMGRRLRESGGKTSLKYSGSGLCRGLFYVWTLMHVLGRPNADTWLHQQLDSRAASERHPNQKQKSSQSIEQMSHDCRNAKGSKKERHQARVKASMNLSFRITRLLYDEMLKEFTA